MKLIGLYRELECSPGRHRSNDVLLLDQVAQVLRTHGCEVELMSLSTTAPGRAPDGLVFSMCQGRTALDVLRAWETDGARIVNSPSAALNTYRERLTMLMQQAGVPFPSTNLLPTSKGSDAGIDPAVLNGGVWLKRGDMHASVPSDVQWVDSMETLRAGLKEFAARGISKAAVQHHFDGDEIKFYGVAGGRFFHWFYPAKETAGSIPRHPIDVRALQSLAEQAAAAAGLEVFGGDVIVSPSGGLTLIDLNDWPSFAPCRDRAAEAIAGYLMGCVNVAWNRGLVSISHERAV